MYNDIYNMIYVLEFRFDRKRIRKMYIFVKIVILRKTEKVIGFGSGGKGDLSFII